MALAPGSVVVEIGSHRGRSTVVLGAAAKTVGATVTAIDPFVEGKLFGGPATRGIFEQNIMKAGLDGVVSLRPVPSDRARAQWAGTVDLLYIDGKHDYWTVVDDLRWRLVCGRDARVLVHDSFCSVGVTSALLHRVVGKGELRYLGRETTMAEFDLAVPTPADRRRVLAELPWFARNVIIKAALRLRAKRLLVRLGHDSPDDPY